MAVTVAEQAATRKATHFGERLWGEVARGIRYYSPAGALARARGVMFEMKPTRALVPKAIDEEKAYQALRDLVGWLRLRDSWAYLESIRRDGAKIFERVPVCENLQHLP